MNKRPAIFLVCSLLALVTLAAYWPVTTHRFVDLDDHHYIYDNPHVKAGLTGSGVLWAFRTGYASNWHPLTWLSHMADCQLYGVRPAGHHLTNLLFHIANTLLLFLLLRRLTGSLWRSACVAALFAWHPLHVESVAWASERKDVLSTLLFLLTLWAYVRYTEAGRENAECRMQNAETGTTHHAPRTTHHASRYYLLALAFFVLALMSKPMVVTLPFVLLLLDFWPLRRALLIPTSIATPRTVPSPHDEGVGRGPGRGASTNVVTAERTTPSPQPSPRSSLAGRGSGEAAPVVPKGWAPLQRLRLVLLQGSRFKVQGSKFDVPSSTPAPQPSPLWPLVREKLPFFALAFAASLVTYLVQQKGGAVSSLDLLPLSSRIANALVAYARYLSQSLWPAHLAAIYPYARHLPVAAAVAAGLLLIGLTAGFGLSARRHPFLIVGWLWFLGTLVPTIGLVQVGSQSMADRYMYIPSIGLFLLIVWGLDALVARISHAPVAADVSLRYSSSGNSAPTNVGGYLLGTAATLALAGCLVCTWNLLKSWQDSEHLYRRAVAVTKDNCIAYDGLGNALEASGKHEEALACYAEAVRLKPNYPEAQYDLGSALMKQGKLDEAVQHFGAALKYNPAFAHAHINLGKTLLEQGKLPEAADHFSQAVRLTPDDAEAHYNLGTILFMQGKLDEAIVSFTEALRLNPDSGEAHGNLGVALMRQGKLGDGATHLAAAARLNPNNPEAHYNLGLALLDLNHPLEAAEQFTEALRLNPDAPGPHYHLALALKRQDKPKDALPHAQKARDLAQAAGQSALAIKAEELLKQLR